MALRTYGPQTLNDGWCEERAPALNGVVADYGNREYGTTFDDDFKKQKKQRAMCNVHKHNEGRNLVVA